MATPTLNHDGEESNNSQNLVNDNKFVSFILLWFITSLVIAFYFPWDYFNLPISTNMDPDESDFGRGLLLFVNLYILLPSVALTLRKRLKHVASGKIPNHYGLRWIRLACLLGLLFGIVGSIASVMESGEFGVYSILFWGGVLFLQRNTFFRLETTEPQLIEPI